MREIIDVGLAVAVEEHEYACLLGFPPNHEFTGPTRELADWARDWYSRNARPWVYARLTESFAAFDGQVHADGVLLTAPTLLRALKDSKVESAFLVAVSAGEECEVEARRLWQEGKPDEYFFLEVYGSAVVEHLITRVAYQLCEWADQNGVAVLPHDSPGYRGWPITDQSALLDAITQTGRYPLPGDLGVLSSGMLSPKKSQLGLFGITHNAEEVRRITELIRCERCSLSSCRFRRVPFRSQKTPGQRRYSLSDTTLKKWSTERLEIRVTPDQSTKARFRYDGTTCTNLGRVLSYEYLVHLGPADGGYPIVDAQCRPASNDTGTPFMCKVIENPVKLRSEMDGEKPMVGAQLKEIWGLVFEVLHYALIDSNHTPTETFRERP